METLTTKSGWEVVDVEWPDFTGKTFKERPKSVLEILENAVRRYPDTEAFIGGDWRLTYSQFDLIVNRIASGLENYGVKRGDRVAVLLGIQSRSGKTGQWHKW